LPDCGPPGFVTALCCGLIARPSMAVPLSARLKRALRCKGSPTVACTRHTHLPVGAPYYPAPLHRFGPDDDCLEKGRFAGGLWRIRPRCALVHRVRCPLGAARGLRSPCRSLRMRSSLAMVITAVGNLVSHLPFTLEQHAPCYRPIRQSICIVCAPRPPTLATVVAWLHASFCTQAA
jgi:hypothetical protein